MQKKEFNVGDRIIFHKGILVFGHMHESQHEIQIEGSYPGQITGRCHVIAWGSKPNCRVWPVKLDSQTAPFMCHETHLEHEHENS